VDVTFRDRILTCGECGNEFVYTIGEQRMAYQENGFLETPNFCPVCEVKIERMGVGSNGQEKARSDYESEQPTNGFRPQGNGYRDHSAGEEPQPTDERSADRSSFSPNRPADYRSGEEHPLCGHNGERHEGAVKWFNDRKGFGFITLDNGIEIFVHYSGIQAQGYRTLKQGQRVCITVEDTDRGPQAGNVIALNDNEIASPD
jgi:cold shock protein